MRVIVTGSRNWKDWKLVWEALDMILQRVGQERFTVVHGDCETGADRCAKDWVTSRHQVNLNVTEEPHRADWSMGMRAGTWRNQHMANLGAEVVLAFINRCNNVYCDRPKPHDSHGTANMIQEAQARGIHIIRFPGYEENSEPAT